MTEGEKMVWAATYAAQWSLMRHWREHFGVPVSVPTAIENARAAVVEMRTARKTILEDWGEAEELSMLDEMIAEDGEDG